MTSTSPSSIKPETGSARKSSQPRFFCSNCKKEIFLSMIYCDECGGRIEWPVKYRTLTTASSRKIRKWGFFSIFRELFPSHSWGRQIR